MEAAMQTHELVAAYQDKVNELETSEKMNDYAFCKDQTPCERYKSGSCSFSARDCAFSHDQVCESNVKGLPHWQEGGNAASSSQHQPQQQAQLQPPKPSA